MAQENKKRDYLKGTASLGAGSLIGDAVARETSPFYRRLKEIKKDNKRVSRAMVEEPFLKRILERELVKIPKPTKGILARRLAVASGVGLPAAVGIYHGLKKLESRKGRK